MYFVRTIRRFALACVVAACAAQPIALDACHAACDRARSARIATAPPCHHASAAGPQIGRPDRPCGQEHAVVPADRGVGARTPSIGWVSVSPCAPLFAAVAPRGVIAGSSPSPPTIPLALISNIPLRV
jgi:hypothetical protein